MKSSSNTTQRGVVLFSSLARGLEAIGVERLVAQMLFWVVALLGAPSFLFQNRWTYTKQHPKKVEGFFTRNGVHVLKLTDFGDDGCVVVPKVGKTSRY